MHVGPPTPIEPDRRRATRNVNGEYAAGVMAKLALWTRSRRGMYRAAASLAVLCLIAAIATPQFETGASASASTVPECSSNQLQVMFIPESPGLGTEGAVFLQNISSHDCSLSGQPSIRIFNRAGVELNHSRVPLSLGSAPAPSTEPDTSECQFILSRRRMELVWFRHKPQANRHRVWRMEATGRDPVLVRNSRLLFRPGV